MSTTVEVRFAAGSGAGELDRAMSALGDLAGAFELYDKAPRPILLALILDNDAERARGRVSERLAAEHIVTDAVLARAKLPASWIGWREPLRRLQVGPVWIEQTTTPRGGLHLAIESDRAFGSGLHPTTALMLARILELSPLPELLDVGTGSGILALAALLLGAPRATGLEIDPRAVMQANENARRNRLQDRFAASSRTPREVARSFPLVLANIITAVLLELAEELADAVAPGGRLILCGMRTTDVAAIAERFGALGLRRGEEAETEGWVRLEFSKL